VLHCDLSFSTPAENLAGDEALLEASEAGELDEVLRFWAPAQYFVVLGYANRRATEVNLEFCRTHNVPVLRRCSGGGTVLQGPGCLNYALILKTGESGPRQSIPGTNDEVLKRHRDLLARLLSAPVQKQGQTDLTLGELKFSGNAQRRRKNYLLFHGSFLLKFDLHLMEKVLPMPSHQPAYRAGRTHADFLVNFPLAAEDLKRALVQTWQASEPLTAVPLARIERLAREKYSQESWNAKF
jgi:lipoate-protein ligase A